MKKLIIVSFFLSLFSVGSRADGVTDWGEAYADFPRLCKELSENMDNSDICADIVGTFLEIDGPNLASPGHPKALEMTREALRRNPSIFPAYIYLALKGNESDIELLKKVDESGEGDNGYFSAWGASEGLRMRRTDSFPGGPDGGYFAMSFANTGPQAVYVLEIWRKNGEKMVEKWGGRDGWYRGEIEERDRLADIVGTLVVSFDTDGNPVSNLDLEKYGLSMPVITPKPHPSIPYYEGHVGRHPEYTVVFPHETTNAPSTDATLNSPPAEGWTKGGVVPDDEAIQPPDETTQDATPKQPIPRLYIGISALLCLCVIAYLVWKTNQKKSV